MYTYISLLSITEASCKPRSHEAYTLRVSILKNLGWVGRRRKQLTFSFLKPKIYLSLKGRNYKQATNLIFKKQLAWCQLCLLKF